MTWHVRIWSLNNDENPSVRSVCLSGDGSRMLVGTAGNEIYMVSAADGSDVQVCRCLCVCVCAYMVSHTVTHRHTPSRTVTHCHTPSHTVTHRSGHVQGGPITAGHYDV